MSDMSKRMMYQVSDNNKKMTTVGNMMKRLLDADAQLLVKAGFINGDLDLTDAGRKALWALIFDANKTELVKEAQIVIDEAKAAK